MPSKEVYTLQKTEELRIEVDANKSIELTLLTGTAEIFGNELPKKKVFSLGTCKIAVFSWHGATLEIEGDHHAYVANETPMGMYANFHSVLESRRRIAMNTGSPGPRVLISGPADTGKSSLAKILMGYAARQNRKAIFADLDVGQGCVTVPGMLAAIHADRPYNIEEGFSKRAPLVYFYGHNNLDKNADCYNRQVATLFKQIDDLAGEDPEVACAGVIINTCGWVTGKGYNILLDTIKTTKADVVVVLDNERLYNDLAKVLTSHTVEVVKLPKSGGVVTRPPDFRRNTRKDIIRQYFYGPNNDLSPRVITLNWAAIALYRVGGGFQAPLCALPIGTESVQDPVSLELINPSVDLEHSIVAVSYSQDESTLLDFNIAGYLHIKAVNAIKGKITFLAPCSLQLPSRYLLVGDIEWIDSS